MWRPFGIPEMGAVIHTLNLRLSRDQLAYIINHAGDRVILLDESQIPLLESIREQIAGVQHFVIWSGRSQRLDLPGEVHRYEELLAAADCRV